MGSSRNYTSVTNRLTVTQASTINDAFASGGTISAWINVTNATAAYRIIDKSGGGTTANPASGYMFYIQTDGGTGYNIRFWQASGAGGNSRVAYFGNTGLAFGVWYYVTVTYNASNVANVPIFYIDGSVETTTDFSLTPGAATVADSTNTLYLGGNRNSDRGLVGFLCHCQMWKTILTQDQILESMIKPGTVRSSLAGYWTILGADSPERDLSGNGNTAAVTTAASSFNGPKVTKSK